MGCCGTLEAAALVQGNFGSACICLHVGWKEKAAAWESQYRLVTIEGQIGLQVGWFPEAWIVL